MSRTVQDLIEEIRDQVDETNTVDLEDPEILAVLNRSQRKAVNIVSRRYSDAFWSKTSVTTTSGEHEYDYPAKAFGKRLLAVTTSVAGRDYKITRLENQKKHLVSTTTAVAVPRHYCVTKDKLELLPPPSSAIDVDLHYFEAPETLVIPQGRVSAVNVASNYLTVDTIGSSLTTATTGFGCYINVVDWQTGKVKGTYQINALTPATDRVTIKAASLTRATVLGKTVDTTLADTIEADDYVCLVTGTCVPELDDAYRDFLVNESVRTIKRRFSEPTQEDAVAAKEDEESLRMMWSNRESAHRVTKKNPHWRKF